MPSDFPFPGELIPHRSPMLLLRTVLAHDASHTECEGWLDTAFAQFCAEEVSAAFGLEIIAQAAAVHHGLRRRADGSEHPSVSRGLLLGSRRLRLAARILPIEVALRVTIRSEGQPAGSGGMIRFEGAVTDPDGRLLAEGNVTVLEWRPDE